MEDSEENIGVDIGAERVIPLMLYNNNNPTVKLF